MKKIKELKEYTFEDLLNLSEDNKMKAIQMLINSIAEERAYTVIASIDKLNHINNINYK